MNHQNLTPQLQKAYKDYISHQRGLAFFKLWVEKWENIGELRWNEEMLCAFLSPLSSRRFIIGSPKTSRGVRGRNIFLGIQKDERKFFSRIPWKRVIFEQNEENLENSTLWFISDIGHSPDMSWPDLPPIAIGIVVDSSYLENWSANKIDLRGVWKDEGKLKIDRQPLTSIKVIKGLLNEEWTKSERQGIKTLKDIVQEQIDKTNVPFDPGFNGQLPPLNKSQQEYLSPFVDKEPPDLIESRYPEIFGQFLDIPPQNE